MIFLSAVFLFFENNSIVNKIKDPVRMALELKTRRDIALAHRRLAMHRPLRCVPVG